MSLSHPTIADIARACGVSLTTVSRVLRSSPIPSAATRKRVEAEIQRQGYVYNRTAADLRLSTSSYIALVINDLSNPYFAEFYEGVEEVLSNNNYVTLLGCTSESTERQQFVLSALLEHNPDGIILSPAEGSNGEHLHRIIGTHTPVLIFNRKPPHVRWADSRWDYHALDNHRGAQLATEHLLQQGHRRIAFLGGHADSRPRRERYEGYLEAMTAAGIPVSPSWLVESAPNRLAAAEQASVLLMRDPALTAAVCLNDVVALGLMLGLAAIGRRPGHDFAVTGFDNILESSVCVPPLTTLATHPRARGCQAAQRIIDRIHNPDCDSTHAIASCNLVVRASTCPAATASNTG